MELLETKTKRTAIRVKYDIESKQTRGNIYTKDEKVGQEVCVGYITDEIKGTGTIHIYNKYKNIEHIKEDVEELKPEFAAISNMWEARAARGFC